MKHPITWRTPLPLWDLVNSRDRARQPVLLRFARDGFMDDLATVLAERPDALRDFVARPETGSDEDVGWQEEESGELTLYQPLHGRFYLVAASLVCRVHGLPDRAVDRGAEERVTFVVRRLTEGGEEAWDGDRQGGTWRGVDDALRLAPFEERLPLFTLTFDPEGTRRHLHAGLVPVAGREIYHRAAGDDGFYALRCVHERRACPFDEPVLSHPSRKFRLAALDDSRAPVHPLATYKPTN